jgi:hypothetical protein
MPSLSGDIVNRVRRLPKPTGGAEALQPLFEAVSNAMHAVDDSGRSGRIDVTIDSLDNPGAIDISVVDNGIGLDDDRFAAFLTTDTDFKFKRGGKGIGRLLWLDAFERIKVSSVYEAEGKLWRRSFDFVLARDEQIKNLSVDELSVSEATGTSVKFQGLRGNAYASKFPSRADTVIKHFGSHFIAEFILGNSPTISVAVGDTLADFPAGIRDLLIGERGHSEIATDAFGSCE